MHPIIKLMAAIDSAMNFQSRTLPFIKENSIMRLQHAKESLDFPFFHCNHKWVTCDHETNSANGFRIQFRAYCIHLFMIKFNNMPSACKRGFVLFFLSKKVAKNISKCFAGTKKKKKNINILISFYSIC